MDCPVFLRFLVPLLFNQFVNAPATEKKPPRWLNRTVLGIGLASLLSDWSHEIATTVLPAFLASMGAAAAWLGVIEEQGAIGEAVRQRATGGVRAGAVPRALQGPAEECAGRSRDRVGHRVRLRAGAGYRRRAAGTAPAKSVVGQASRPARVLQNPLFGAFTLSLNPHLLIRSSHLAVHRLLHYLTQSICPGRRLQQHLGIHAGPGQPRKGLVRQLQIHSAFLGGNHIPFRI